ncbi:MAG: DoxX family protein [Oceanicoccus sp.]
MSSDLIQKCQRMFLLVGRGLLGLYFIVPGITKITGFAAMTEYMAAHNVPLVPVLLVVTIVVQIGGGACLAIGYRTQLMAFVLAGLTLVISVFMHNFWAMESGMEQAHEMQNFVKNMAIMAGLMYAVGVSTSAKSS